MKRIKYHVLLIACLLAAVVTLSACTTLLEKKHMEKYYSDDDHYVSVSVKIMETYSCSYGWEIWTYPTENEDFYCETLSDNVKFVRFILPNECYEKLSEKSIELQREKTYVFTSAISYWFDSFPYPIVEIKDAETDEVYLEFEFGKQSYIDWIWNDLN